MNLKSIRSFCAVMLMAASAGAFAQTCASPRVWQPPVAGEVITGLTTCGGDTTAFSYCAGNQSAVGPAFVFRLTMAPPRTYSTITLSGGAAGFDPVMYMSAFADGCGTNAACGPSGDTGFPILTADVANGEWYLIVTAASIDAPNACGAFTILTDGSYPVALQGFTVD